MRWNNLSTAVLALVASVPAFAAQAPVSVEIKAAKTVLQANDDVVVNVTITNRSNKDQLVLKSATPFDDDADSLFHVVRDGVKVPYLGARTKRAAPQAGDYFVLKAGKSYTQAVELSSQYDMSQTGSYTIAYRADKHQALQGVAAGLQSDSLTLWINGHTRTQPAPTLRQALAGTVSTLNCSAAQTADIVTAVGNAKTYASGALSYMNAGVAGARYTTWFGVNDATRYSTVTSHYGAILDAFNTKDVVVDCKCKKTYYAYVNPNAPYVITVCKAFWTAPAQGTDSKAGTLIHEMSHFNVTAGTNDWVYGQSGAQSLAVSDPAKAIDNADSHEYFAENNPFQN